MNSYNYDQWGKLLSQSGTSDWARKMMNLNPLRYRGYVYDSDSGLYYLQSRYYDPTTCRFINADDICNTRPALTDTNIFTYCQNNPVNMVDNNGEIPDWVITGAIHLAITNFWGFLGWAEYYLVKGKLSVVANIYLSHENYPIAKALFNKSMWGDSLSRKTIDRMKNAFKNSYILKTNRGK
ncbi:MAG: RHS repeat-associated core domain-containing protein [Bacillota bacterium]|nr:RHS repeat-associated core domain-containing protein [Bacillota bacterium]